MTIEIVKDIVIGKETSGGGGGGGGITDINSIGETINVTGGSASKNLEVNTTKIASVDYVDGLIGDISEALDEILG